MAPTLPPHTDATPAAGLGADDLYYRAIEDDDHI
jgi:hypothetical protein